MAKLLIDEVHLSILVPGGLTAPEQIAIRRCLNGAHFNRTFRKALRTFWQRFPSLKHASLRVSR